MVKQLKGVRLVLVGACAASTLTFATQASAQSTPASANLASSRFDNTIISLSSSDLSLIDRTFLVSSQSGEAAQERAQVALPLRELRTLEYAHTEPDKALLSSKNWVGPHDINRDPKAAAVGQIDEPIPPADLVVSIEYKTRWKDVKKLELAYQFLNAVDAIQTVSCLSANTCTEQNPLYGSRPSAAKVIGMKAVSGAFHYLMTRVLLDRAPKAAKPFQYFSIAVQGGVVGWNFSQTF